MNVRRIGIAVVSIMAFVGCQTVGVPKIDEIMKSPQFSEDAASYSADYPDVEDTPLAPTDIRSDKEWDKAANAMLALQKDAMVISDTGEQTEAEVDRRFEELKAKAQAYKKDDPVSGPVQGFPNYKPRR